MANIDDTDGAALSVVPSGANGIVCAIHGGQALAVELASDFDLSQVVLSRELRTTLLAAGTRFPHLRDECANDAERTTDRRTGNARPLWTDRHSQILPRFAAGTSLARRGRRPSRSVTPK